MNKIEYFIRTDINLYPPCIAQLELLVKNGYQVTLTTYHLTEESKEWLTKQGVKFNLLGKDPLITKSKVKKISRYFKFKRKLTKYLRSIDTNTSTIFIGSEETALAIGKSLKKYKYVMNVFELNDKSNYLKVRLIKKYARLAEELIVPEYNRAYILKVNWNLSKIPNIMPNKPIYNLDNVLKSENSLLDEYVYNGYKIILYQGILNSERNIRPIARALNKIDSKYVLVLMTSKLFKEETDIVRNIYADTVVIDFIQPPNHMDITRRAFIGITTYDLSSLNTVFCAPNKIYEYSMVNVPILANELPGLKYTVEAYNAGICTDLEDENKIALAINNIELNYKKFQDGAKRLYSSVDNEDILIDIIERLK